LFCFTIALAFRFAWDQITSGALLGALCALSVGLVVFARRRRRQVEARVRALNSNLLQKGGAFGGGGGKVGDAGAGEEYYAVVGAAQ
jgi:hypothetical protein